MESIGSHKQKAQEEQGLPITRENEVSKGFTARRAPSTWGPPNGSTHTPLHLHMHQKAMPSLSHSSRSPRVQ